jgi:hypothetical protein
MGALGAPQGDDRRKLGTMTCLAESEYLIVESP